MEIAGTMMAMPWESRYQPICFWSNPRRGASSPRPSSTSVHTAEFRFRKASGDIESYSWHFAIVAND
jgi:hypothetical protein